MHGKRGTLQKNGRFLNKKKIPAKKKWRNNVKNYFALPCSQSSSSARMHVKQLECYVPNLKCGTNQPRLDDYSVQSSQQRVHNYFFFSLNYFMDYKTKKCNKTNSNPIFQLYSKKKKRKWFTGCSRCQFLSHYTIFRVINKFFVKLEKIYIHKFLEIILQKEKKIGKNFICSVEFGWKLKSSRFYKIESVKIKIVWIEKILQKSSFQPSTKNSRRNVAIFAFWRKKFPRLIKNASEKFRNT